MFSAYPEFRPMFKKDSSHTILDDVDCCSLVILSHLHELVHDIMRRFTRKASMGTPPSQGTA